MRSFYAVQSVVLASSPPPAPYDAVQSPDNANWSLVVVEAWPSPIDQDTWEDLPGVIEAPIWNWGAIVPTLLANAFASWGVVTTDTLAQAMRKIRAKWRAARA